MTSSRCWCGRAVRHPRHCRQRRPPGRRPVGRRPGRPTRRGHRHDHHRFRGAGQHGRGHGRAAARRGLRRRRVEPLQGRRSRRWSNAAPARRPTSREVLATGRVLSILAHDAAFRAVFTPDVLAAAPAGCVHANMATVSVEAAGEFAAAHAAAGVGYVAAPVIGRPPVAAAGKLNIVVAGPDEARAPLRRGARRAGRPGVAVRGGADGGQHRQDRHQLPDHPCAAGAGRVASRSSNGPGSTRRPSSSSPTTRCSRARCTAGTARPSPRAVTCRPVSPPRWA